jgi:hypothetical protein
MKGPLGCRKTAFAEFITEDLEELVKTRAGNDWGRQSATVFYFCSYGQGED